MKSDNFVNIFKVCDMTLPFHILQGARGYGKTYSATAGVNGLTPDIYKPIGRYLWLRRTQDELEATLADKELSPFTQINKDYNIELYTKRINKKVYGCYLEDVIMGYMAALSTIGTIRGSDFSTVSIMIEDEFVPEKHIKKMPYEANAIFNAYETVNRNREMFGQPPVQMFFLSNSNDINNPLCSELGIINKIEKLARKLEKQKSGVTKNHPLSIVDRERGFEFHLLESAPQFKKAKAESALYKLTKGSKFSAMALDNAYAFNDFSLVKYRKTNCMHPMFAVDEIYVWGGETDMYATYYKGQVAHHYKSDNKHDVLAINRAWRVTILDCYMAGEIDFETYAIKHKILQILEVIR